MPESDYRFSSMQNGKEPNIMIPKNPNENPIQETEPKRLKARLPKCENPFSVSESFTEAQKSKPEESTQKSQRQDTKEEESSCNAITSTIVANKSEGTVEDSTCSGRERLKRHRVEVAGQVWIPDIWGQEDFLKDWIDCTAFDASLVNSRIMSARASLVDEGRRANSTGLRVQNGC
ncbi:hypothetical protein CDL12_01569 [Handroanthus impetiginosus]|uniref:Protein BIC1 n=1 Tax=Handroanthus impetiginosus TaxID=429701 RepID=A0A2G9I7S0_9LAMI|nr:hypothetical protein CDL12_01569 [Handroanthus impetiginosus]